MSDWYQRDYQTANMLGEDWLDYQRRFTPPPNETPEKAAERHARMHAFWEELDRQFEPGGKYHKPRPANEP